MTDRRSIALLLALHLVIVAIVQPRGNFPLNDDWNYAHSVQWLLSEGRVRLSDWIAMNLLPQTLAGGLVTAMLGFSFETLRHLTQFVAAGASLAAYFFFRSARLAPGDATVATMAVVAFPAWPVLANSYMTDLYAMLLALPAAALFMRALERPARGTLIVATVLAVLGILQRQVVLVLPVAFLVAWLWSQRQWTLRALLVGIAPVAAVLGAALLYHMYLVHGPGVPEAHRWQYGRLVPMLLKAFTNEDRHGEFVILNLLTIFGYFGLFAIGWAAWWGLRDASRATWRFVIVGGIVIAAIAVAFGWLPPYRPNQVLDAAGIGPFTLHDVFVRGAVLERGAGRFWPLMAIAGAFGAAALVALIAVNVKHLVSERRDADRERVFLLAVIGAYLFPFIAIDYIDRYFLFPLPFIFLLWVRTWSARSLPPNRLQRAAGVAWIAGVIGLSSVATHDYFAWNRARWDAIRTAHSLGATPETLDGGFEYNGYERFQVKPRDTVPGKSWWWVKDDLYVVTFTPVPGYEEVQAFPVRRWLSRTPPVVRLLRRK